MNQPKDMVNVAETGALLGVSKFMVRSLVRQKKIPFFRVGRRIVLSRRDIEAFLTKCREGEEEQDYSQGD